MARKQRTGGGETPHKGRSGVGKAAAQGRSGGGSSGPPRRSPHPSAAVSPVPSPGSPWTHPVAARIAPWVALALFVALAMLVPAYHARLGSTVSQVHLLPQRLKVTTDQIQFQTKGEKFDLVRTARARTFPDAVILVSDNPADGPLSQILWLAYYLYPRVLVQSATVNAHPELQVDFMLVTRNFPPPEHRPDGASVGVSVISERAQEYALQHWGQP